jgi:hypothetical protein
MPCTIRHGAIMKYIALVGLLWAAACDSPTEGGAVESTPHIEGGWDYTATQSSPALRMSGTLTITAQDGNAISGSLDYMETDAAGIARRRIEMFNGRIRGKHSISLDAITGDGTRKHTGSIVNDSMGGNVEKPKQNGTLHGSFSARRR